MQIAVLSGKGGTGKTFISVNLASIAGDSIYIDCDVEEPNGWLFLKPKVEKTRSVEVAIPQVDREKCTGCRRCVDFCKFGALAYTPDKLMVFPKLCHSCGGCILLCPQKALREEKRELGRVEYGTAGEVHTRTGILNTGEASGVPIIKELLAGIPASETVVIDCPPGSSCTVMDSIRDSDYCLLVTEPTAFGVHNLALVWELVKLMDKPHGVLINKAIAGEKIAETFCTREKIPVLQTIPYDPNLAYLISNGQLAVEDSKYRQVFQDLLARIRREANR